MSSAGEKLLADFALPPGLMAISSREIVGAPAKLISPPRSYWEPALMIGIVALAVPIRWVSGRRS